MKSTLKIPRPWANDIENFDVAFSYLVEFKPSGPGQIMLNEYRTFVSHDNETGAKKELIKAIIIHAVTALRDILLDPGITHIDKLQMITLARHSVHEYLINYMRSKIKKFFRKEKNG